jgi:hypothetical protein
VGFPLYGLSTSGKESEMKSKRERSIGIRAFNAVCALVVLACGVFMLIAGFHFVAAAALLGAVAGVAGPAVVAGEGVLDMIAGVFEAIIDGIMAVFEAISSLLCSLFG